MITIEIIRKSGNEKLTFSDTNSEEIAFKKAGLDPNKFVKTFEMIDGYDESGKPCIYMTIREIRTAPPTGMIAILCYVDGFGHDTYVKSIHQNMDDAKKKHAMDIKENPDAENDLWTEFEFGDVDFNIYSPYSYSFDD